MRLFTALLSLSLVAASCERTPAEPAPSRAPSAQVVPPVATEKAVPAVTADGTGRAAASTAPADSPVDAASAPVAATAPPAHALSAAGRCLRPTPATPPPAVPKGPDPNCPRDPEGGPPMVPVGHVTFLEAAGAPALEVELMLTEAHQERGLMYRKSLPDDRGMLFAWPTPSIHNFWMHNTCLPLDMLFIDKDGFVSGIVENAPTLNDGSRSIDCPVNYVLEVNAGWARRHGVRAGQFAKIEGVPALAPAGH